MAFLDRVIFDQPLLGMGLMLGGLWLLGAVLSFF